MKNHPTIRKSNFELMRIISMYMIIVNHILDQKIMSSSTGTVQLIIVVINAIIRVHVCSFILLCGYFQCKKNMKMTKLISINNAVWFYNIVYMIVLSALGIVSLSIVDKLKIISPISYNDYWFVSLYIILYLISPILNKIINNITKKQFQKILIILMCIFSILPSLTNQVAFNNHNGFSLGSFIFLYLIGAYLRSYPIKNSFIFKKMTNNMFKLTCFCSFFLLVIINISLYYSGSVILTYGDTMNYIGNVVVNNTFSYDNPIIVIQSICFFIYFSTLNINCNMINKIGKYTFGIYLVHENPLIKTVFYKYLGFSKSFYHIDVIPRIFIAATLIFIVSLLIEFIRASIFKFIYNRKVSQRFRKKYQQYIKSLGININW